MDAVVTVKMTPKEFDLIKAALRQSITSNEEAYRRNTEAKDYRLATQQKGQAATYELLLTKLGG